MRPCPASASASEGAPLGPADADNTYVASVAIAGTAEDVDRQARRQVRVTKEHKSEVQRLLKLMGIPFHDVRARLSVPASLDPSYRGSTNRSKLILARL